MAQLMLNAGANDLGGTLMNHGWLLRFRVQGSMGLGLSGFRIHVV